MTADISNRKTTLPSFKFDDDGEIGLKMTTAQAKALCGSNLDSLPYALLTQLVNSLPGLTTDEQGADKMNAAIAMLTEIGPRDGLEGMLAAQMVAIHHLSLECAKRAVLPEQTFEGVNSNVNRVTKLMRTFTAQMEALQRYRNGGKQTIKVQHVNVENGGQAIVGDVKGGGRG